jgi:hypothetical protein
MAGTAVLVLDWDLELGFGTAVLVLDWATVGDTVTGTAVLVLDWDLSSDGIASTAVLTVGWSGRVPGIPWACLGKSAWVRVLVGVEGTTGVAMGRVIWLKLSKEILLVGCMA